MTKSVEKQTKVIWLGTMSARHMLHMNQNERGARLADIDIDNCGDICGVELSLVWLVIGAVGLLVELWSIRVSVVDAAIIVERLCLVEVGPLARPVLWVVFCCVMIWIVECGTVTSGVRCTDAQWMSIAFIIVCELVVIPVIVISWTSVAVVVISVIRSSWDGCTICSIRCCCWIA